jgi:hypothetical protein
MLDAGFENDIRRIIAHCPDKTAGRQTVMCTYNSHPRLNQWLTFSLRYLARDSPTSGCYLLERSRPNHSWIR